MAAAFVDKEASFSASHARKLEFVLDVRQRRLCAHVFCRRRLQSDQSISSSFRCRIKWRARRRYCRLSSPLEVCFSTSNLLNRNAHFPCTLLRFFSLYFLTNCLLIERLQERGFKTGAAFCRKQTVDLFACVTPEGAFISFQLRLRTLKISPLAALLQFFLRRLAFFSCHYAPAETRRHSRERERRLSLLLAVGAAASTSQMSA